MKKFTSVILLLSIIGSILSGMLVVLHYFPGSPISVLCGGELVGNCDAVNESGYSTLLDVPVAAYGLFFYLVILCTMLVADYAEGPYYAAGLALLTPLVILSLLVDLILLLLLFKLRLFCLLCALTYAINLLLLITVLASLRQVKKQEAVAFGPVAILMRQIQSPEHKAAASSYLLLVVFLGFSVFSTTYILKMKSGLSPLSGVQVSDMLKQFYSLKVESINLPASNLVLGSPKGRVKITAFIDFLCPPCRRLFALDQKLCGEYTGDVSVSYYNFPLDGTCNPNVKETIHPFSCVASRAVISAGELNILLPFLKQLFDPNVAIDSFRKETAVTLSNGLSDPVVFSKSMDAEATNQTLLRDIGLAKALGIDSTPTLFIDGRRIEGVPPQEVLEAIIQRDLAVEK